MHHNKKDLSCKSNKDRFQYRDINDKEIDCLEDLNKFSNTELE